MAVTATVTEVEVPFITAVVVTPVAVVGLYGNRLRLLSVGNCGKSIFLNREGILVTVAMDGLLANAKSVGRMVFIVAALAVIGVLAVVDAC